MVETKTELSLNGDTLDLLMAPGALGEIFSVGRVGVFSMIPRSKNLGFDNMTGFEGSKSVGCYFECCVG